MNGHSELDMSTNLKFRTDIQALRGIAVLLVVLFHFELLSVNGGFIGVDIFFVISGFLMTLILTSDHFQWSGKSIASFYKGRFWRIAPAYYFVLAGIALLPFLNPWIFDYDQFSEAVFASLLMSYNIVAPSHTDYFAVDVLANPFLHLWSLGVEIQFYLIWPLILFGLRNKKASTRINVVLIIALISFVACEILLVKDARVAYFSLPGRLWQFCFGALAALAIADSAPKSSRVVTLAALFAPLVYGLFGFIDFSYHWPGAFAVPLTLTTACLLYVGASGGLFAKLFQNKLLNFVGLISYSLYLVHWPIFIVIANSDTKTDISRLLGALASIITATLVYYFLEVPLRKNGKCSFSLRGVSFQVALASLALGMALIASSPDLKRVVIPEQMIKFNEASTKAKQIVTYDCRDGKKIGCLIGDAGYTPEVAYWGDSHTQHLLVGLENKYLKEKKSARVVSHSGCSPFLGVEGEHSIKKKCRSTLDQMLNLLELKENIKTVVLSARWAQYYREDRDLFRREIRNTINYLTNKGKRVVIATQVPEFANSLRFRSCKVEVVRDGQAHSDNCTIREIDKLEEQYAIDQELKDVASSSEMVSILDSKKAFCENGRCQAAKADKLFWRDEDHLSAEGSRKVVNSIYLGI